MDKRGGKRKGAGRPSMEEVEKKVTISTTIKPETKEKLEELRKRGVRIGHHIDMIVNDLYDELVLGK